MVSRQTVMLAVLIGATIGSFTIGRGIEGHPYLGASLVLAIAAAKARIVILDFMEVRHAPGLLHHVAGWWPIAIFLGLAVLMLV